MSDNPYTMNSLGPVWQQGHDAGQADLADALRRARLEEADLWDENALEGKGVWARKRLAELRRIP